MTDVRQVLFVEDNPADARLVTDLFGEIDADANTRWPQHEVHVASDLASGLALLEEREIHCVLLDLRLPDATGLQALQRVLWDHPTMPIIVFTAADDPDTAEEALAIGAQDFLEKDAPVTAPMLARSIEYAVQRARAAQAVIDSNRQLASFSSMVAHDLRSPLSIAKGMLDLVQRQGEGSLDDELQMLVERAVAAITRAGDLVSALLVYAQSTRPDHQIEPVDLAETAGWVIDAIEIADGQRVEVVPPLPIVSGSPTGLRQVLQNLVSNSLRYAHPDRPATIRVSAESRDDEWVVSVTDNGLGIPPDKREAVFREGERLGQTGDGLGLGLASVRATIERHKGEVWIEDAPDGPGTAVRFSLPKSTGDDPT